MQTERKKERKHDSSLPTGIKWVFITVLAVVGYCLWGMGFVWVCAVVYGGLPVLRGVLSLLCGLLLVAGTMYLILSFLTF